MAADESLGSSADGGQVDETDSDEVLAKAAECSVVVVDGIEGGVSLAGAPVAGDEFIVCHGDAPYRCDFDTLILRRQLAGKPSQ